MEALDQKRSRLRRELQVAYGAWLDANDGDLCPAPGDRRPEPCYAAPAREKWADYLAAKNRLVLAYAEA